MLELWALPLLSAAGILVTAGLWWRARRMLVLGARVPGRISQVTLEKTELSRGRGQGTAFTTFYPHVTFTLPTGSSVEFRGQGLRIPPPVGKVVTVTYDPQQAEATARLDDRVIWRPFVISALLTSSLVMYSLWTFGDIMWLRALWETPIVLFYFVGVMFVGLLDALVRHLPRGPRPVSAYLFGAVIGLYGVGAFYGQMLVATGALTAISPSAEWPVGSAEHVAQDVDGTLIVPLMFCGRVQIYDRTGRFVRGWSVEAAGGDFRARPTSDGHVEVYATRGSLRLVYSREGALLTRTRVDDRMFMRIMDDAGLVKTFPYSWPLWPLVDPARALITGVAGLVLTSFVARKTPPNASWATRLASFAARYCDRPTN